MLRGTTNEPENGREPSNSKHLGSRNVGGKGDTEQERKNMQNELSNCKGKYKKMVRKMGTSSSVNQLLTNMGIPYT